MKRPTWAIIVGVFMLLFGGCGALGKVGDIKTPEMMELVNETIEEAEASYEANANSETEEEGDSIRQTKVTELSDDEKKILEMISDSVEVDSMQNVDFETTMKNSFKFSEYRQTWMVRFGYMGLVVALLFLIGGIMLLASRKYTIPVVLTTLAVSLAFGILQLAIYAADVGTGKMIGNLSSIGIYFSIALDIVFLIIVMVCDKTYFQPAKVIEDYYD